jgi:glycogen(starch) synthase
MKRASAFRVLFLSTEYPPETGWGGIGTYTYNMAKALASRGHDVHVLSVARSQQERHYKDGEVCVHRAAQRDLWRLGRLRWAAIHARHLERALSTYLVSRRLGAEFDIVEYPECGAEGLLFSLQRKTPTVAHLHTPLPLLVQLDRRDASVSERLAAYLEGLSVRRADMISCPSQALAGWTIEQFRLNNRPISIVPHPAPVPSRLPSSVPLEASRHANVLFVGRLELKKNPEIIVKAATLVRRRIPRVDFTFAGGTRFRGTITYRQWLAHLAQAQGLTGHVNFPGHLPREEVDALLAQASVVVVPSRWENCPYVVLEAMVSARPVVASRVGGIPELIRDGETGLLVDPEDTEGWAEALIALLIDPHRARQMGARAQEDALDRFHPAKIAALRETVYHQAIAVHQRQG